MELVGYRSQINIPDPDPENNFGSDLKRFNNNFKKLVFIIILNLTYCLFFILIYFYRFNTFRSAFQTLAVDIEKETGRVWRPDKVITDFEVRLSELFFTVNVFLYKTLYWYYSKVGMAYT